MTDQLISFETAKLAKEKGFKENTNAYHNITPMGDKAEDNPIIVGSINHNYESYNTIAIPTQSLLQKWLREVHHIHVEVGLNFNDKFHYSAVYNRNYVDLFDTIKHKRYNTNFNTYEEALEVGLTEALKFIE